MCGRAFGRRSSLTQHVARVHKLHSSRQQAMCAEQQGQQVHGSLKEEALDVNMSGGATAAAVGAGGPDGGSRRDSSSRQIRNDEDDDNDVDDENENEHARGSRAALHSRQIVSLAGAGTGRQQFMMGVTRDSGTAICNAAGTVAAAANAATAALAASSSGALGRPSARQNSGEGEGDGTGEKNCNDFDNRNHSITSNRAANGGLHARELTHGGYTPWRGQQQQQQQLSTGHGNNEVCTSFTPGPVIPPGEEPFYKRLKTGSGERSQGTKLLSGNEAGDGRTYGTQGGTGGQIAQDQTHGHRVGMTSSPLLGWPSSSGRLYGYSGAATTGVGLGSGPGRTVHISHNMSYDGAVRMNMNMNVNSLNGGDDGYSQHNDEDAHVVYQQRYG